MALCAPFRAFRPKDAGNFGTSYVEITGLNYPLGSLKRFRFPPEGIADGRSANEIWKDISPKHIELCKAPSVLWQRFHKYIFMIFAENMSTRSHMREICELGHLLITGTTFRIQWYLLSAKISAHLSCLEC